MKQFFTSHLRPLALSAAILVVCGVVWYIVSNAAPRLGSYTVTRGDITASIDIPGTVASSNSVNLSFQESGQIAQVYVREGQSVVAGQALASLDSSAQQTALGQAEAALAAAEANLAALTAGTRPEQLAIDQTAVTQDQTALMNAVTSAYTAADSAVHTNADQIFSNARTTNATLTIVVPDATLANQITQERVALEPELTAWSAQINSPSWSTTDPPSAATQAAQYLAQVGAFLNDTAAALTQVQSSGNLSATNLTVYESSIATARANITSALATLTSAKTAFVGAQGALTLAQAGSTSQNIAAQQAQVEEAQAAVNNARLLIDNATIVAPFPGIVRNVTAQSGMVVSPNSPVLSIINNGILKIDAYASEMDVPNVQSNATTSVTLDAYGDSVSFPAKVTAVDTSETIFNNSPAYHVTLYFTGPDDRIRAGMTGNVHIVTVERNNVVEVPSRLVLDNAGTDFVLATSGGKTEHRQVTLGPTGDNGMVEIISGLSTSDTISNF